MKRSLLPAKTRIKLEPIFLALVAACPMAAFYSSTRESEEIDRLWFEFLRKWEQQSEKRKLVFDSWARNDEKMTRLMKVIQKQILIEDMAEVI